MRGQVLNVELLERASELYAQHGNFAEVARKLCVPESTIRTALQRHKIERREGISKRAIERGIRKGSALLCRVIDQAESHLDAQTEPKELAAITQSITKALLTLRDMGERFDRKLQANLTRQKTEVEINFLNRRLDPEEPYNEEDFDKEVERIVRNRNPLYDLDCALDHAIVNADSAQDEHLQAKLAELIERRKDLRADGIEFNDRRKARADSLKFASTSPNDGG